MFGFEKLCEIFLVSGADPSVLSNEDTPSFMKIERDINVFGMIIKKDGTETGYIGEGLPDVQILFF